LSNQSVRDLGLLCAVDYAILCAHEPKGHRIHISLEISLRDIKTLQIHSTSQYNNAISLAKNRQGLAVFIMSHPLLERVGHYYFYPLQTQNSYFDINRTTPVFSPNAMPLADPYINRSGLRIRYQSDDHFTLSKQNPNLELIVDKQPVYDNIALTRASLTIGVVLQLNQRVCLLLKLCPPVQPISHSRFLMHGLSHSLNQVCQQIAFLSPTNEPVLIRGATGTGKELVAQAIVQNSPRRDKPFISVNLGALSPALAAAELFGSSKGAYTGAQKQRNGFMQAADGGTLFLDEIGEANSEVQAMLLRVLETGELFAVGSTVPTQVDVRIIAATDARLDKMISQEKFKAPLLYRLANFELNLENLSERKQDISLLFVHFAHQICQELNIKPAQNLLEDTWLPSQLMQQLLDYHWPGNIRELRNVVRQIIISANNSPVLSLPTEFATKLTPPSAPLPESSTQPAHTKPAPLKRKPATISKDELLDALTQCDHEVSKTADLLNTSRASIYQLMKQFELPNIANISDQHILQLLDEQQDIVKVAKHLQVSQSALRRRLNQIKLK
jgi:two-component system nitrogen regulation response regulator GlnG